MANMTALSINESLFYIPFDHTGVISVCNNKYGNELACIVSEISDDRISLNIGDSVCIKRIVSEGTESVHEFVMPDFSNQKKEFMSDKGIYGMEVCTENNTICMPFIDGGAVTFVVTINQGQVSDSRHSGGSFDSGYGEVPDRSFCGGADSGSDRD